METLLNVIYLAITELRPNPKNARTHSPHQTRQIAASIKEFGFLNPILIDRTNTIVAGHGRVAGAKLLGIDQVPTIRVENLTQDQIRAFALAENRIAEKAGWDDSILEIELQHLINIGGDFDVTVTGFEIPEIDIIIGEARDRQPDKDDLVELNSADQAVTHFGDIWQMGKHRILCGDSLTDASFRTLMAARRADLVFVDPPYNIIIDGNVSGHGQVHHSEFAMASGEMNEVEFVAFLTTSLRLLARYSASESTHYICMDWRHMGELLAVGKQIYDELLNLCVWVKNNGGLGSFYRSRHELVFVFRNGKGRHRNNIQLGKFGRNRTNVWEYPGICTFSRSEEGNLLPLHPTLKPVALVADAVLDTSARGDVVLDAFLGSGTTLIAAERVGRICFGIEIDPRYVDVAIRRWQQHSGDRAVHLASGKSFDEIAAASEGKYDR